MRKFNFHNQGQGLIRVVIILVGASLITGSLYYFLKQKLEVRVISEKPIKETKEKTLDRIDISEIKELPKVIYGVKKMVLIPNGTFYMDETPVSYADFQKYADAGGTKSKYWDYETYNHPEHPVTGLNWYHAVDYCNWRSKIEGLSPAYKLTNQLDAWGYPLWELDNSADGYRLPTEAEFEYAARGGLIGKKFPWGDEFNPSFANFDDERGVMKGKWWRLAKVKDTSPNGYGLYGMSGNIWHWTNDWYNPGRTKVLKGGSWGSISPADLEITNRSFSAPSNYNYDIGFRCILPVRGQIKNLIKNQTIIPQKVAHKFYQYKTSHYENPIQIDFYSQEFINRLSQFIADYYPNCIYFQTKIDKQEIITPKQMAELIIKTTKKYHIHPLFLTGIMAAESGFGSVSFSRWYNNPMAYHWQNVLMKNGLPTYEANPNRNRKYKDLESGFETFLKGIRRDVYFKAAKENLDTFHLIYVGYRADEWMYTISKVYKDVLGIRLEPNFPTKNVGEYIYVDWETLIDNNSLNVIDKILDWGHHTPLTPRIIDTIIIHSSYDALGEDPCSVDGVIYEYKLYGVSPHYLIACNGTIYRLAPDENIAYHVGQAKMPDGRTNVNDFSIGIEIINTKTEPPREIQYQSLVQLVKNLQRKYDIPSTNILGHKDIAPGRKTDPWNFDWQKFYEMIK